LTTKVIACLRRTSLGYTRESTYSIVKELRGQSRASFNRVHAWWR